MKLFRALVKEPNLQRSFIDGSIAKAHQRSAGAGGNTP